MSAVRTRALRHGLILAAVLTDVAIIWVWGPTSSWFYDSVSWWLIDLDHLYVLAEEGLQVSAAFRYAPVVAQLLSPLGSLPWPVFLWTWLVLQLLALVWMGGKRWWVLVLFPPTILELQAGNVHIFMAAAIVAGFRAPAFWAVVALTKVTAGLGVLWFALRREWVKLAVAVGTTAVVAAVGLATDPRHWLAWFELLMRSSRADEIGWGPPRLVRLSLGLALLAWASIQDRRWAVPIAVLLFMPNIWLHSLSLLTATIALAGNSTVKQDAENTRPRKIARRAAPS